MKKPKRLGDTTHFNILYNWECFCFKKKNQLMPNAHQVLFLGKKKY